MVTEGEDLHGLRGPSDWDSSCMLRWVGMVVVGGRHVVYLKMRFLVVSVCVGLCRNRC